MATNDRSAKHAMLALAAIFLAAPVCAMDDQASYGRFAGRGEKRLTSGAPAAEWATSAWIGDDLTRLRIQPRLVNRK